MHGIMPVKVITTVRCLACNWQRKWLDTYSRSDCITPESTMPYYKKLLLRKLMLRHCPSCGKTRLEWSNSLNETELQE